MKRVLKSPLLWGGLFGLAILALAWWLGSIEHCFHDGGCLTNFQIFLQSAPNEIGDALAGFAGALAFAGIIVTILLQSAELQAQRRELEFQRKATQEMAASSASQTVDGFVFELMKTYGEMVSDMDVRAKSGGQVISTGRRCFQFFYKEIGKTYAEDTSSVIEEYAENSPDRYKEALGTFHPKLGHYFRFVYNMLRSIDELSGAKRRHKRLVRSLFSDDELLVLFYNCLTPKGENMKKYAVSFELFDNLPEERLLFKHHVEWKRNIGGSTA